MASSVRLGWRWTRWVVWLTAALSVLACTDDDRQAEASGPLYPVYCGCGAATWGDGGYCVQANIQIDVEPWIIHFDDLPPGSVQKQTVTVRHVGTSCALRVKDVHVEGMEDELRIVGFHEMVLGVGESASFELEYTPKLDGGETAQLVFDSNDTTYDHGEAIDRAYEVPIEIDKPLLLLELSEERVDFDEIAADPATGDRRAVLYLYNWYDHPVPLAKLELDPAGSTDFVLANPPDLSQPLASKSGLALEIVYHNTGSGPDQSELLVETADHRLLSCTMGALW